MRIGFVELLLILLIASLTIGPSAALWVDRWLRRANRASAAAARRRAVHFSFSFSSVSCSNTLYLFCTFVQYSL